MLPLLRLQDRQFVDEGVHLIVSYTPAETAALVLNSLVISG